MSSTPKPEYVRSEPRLFAEMVQDGGIQTTPYLTVAVDHCRNDVAWVERCLTELIGGTSANDSETRRGLHNLRVSLHWPDGGGPTIRFRATPDPNNIDNVYFERLPNGHTPDPTDLKFRPDLSSDSTSFYEADDDTEVQP
jgi:hypothetical protein